MKKGTGNHNGHPSTENGAKVVNNQDITKLSPTLNPRHAMEVVSNIKGIATELEKATTDPYVVSLSEKYDEPHFSLYREGVGTMPRGDIQAIKAKSKNGKSFLCSIFLASLLGSHEFSFETKEASPTVLYFDTEQNKRNTAKLARRVHTLLGWALDVNHDGFQAYALRTMDTPDRLAYIENEVKAKKPTAIFIDGIADLIENFNDVEQSTDLINALMRLSAGNDCCVCCVLHTNKGKDDHGMKGHLGTMLLQKASDVFEVSKNGYTFNVKQTESRNEPIADFAFVLDGHGIPHAGESVKELKATERLNNIKEILPKVFANSESLTFGELIRRYQEQSVVSEATAKRHIRETVKADVLKCEDGRYKRA